MRSHDKPLAPDEAEVLYGGDVKDPETGRIKVMVVCGVCDTSTYSTEVKCPNCMRWFVYRPWWEW